MPATPPVHLERWPWPIHILTLGTFTLLVDDEPVTFARKTQRKPLALLKALIALGANEVPEERLSEILWPDAEGDMAHQVMEVTLHRLRKLLGHQDAVTFRGGLMGLNERLCWVDVHAFERLLALADQAAKQGDTDRQRTLLERAVTLRRGDFLAAEGEEWWLAALAARLQSKYLQSLWRLGEIMAEAGRWDRAADCYEGCLGTNDCLEETYRRLMVCYHRMDRHFEALEVYRRCRQTLANGHGTSPSPETEAVRAAILRYR